MGITPINLYSIRPGLKGKTSEWGRITVLRIRGGTVFFESGGGRGRPGKHSTTRSILFEATNWG